MDKSKELQSSAYIPDSAKTLRVELMRDWLINKFTTSSLYELVNKQKGYGLNILVFKHKTSGEIVETNCIRTNYMDYQYDYVESIWFYKQTKTKTANYLYRRQTFNPDQTLSADQLFNENKKLLISTKYPYPLLD